MQSSERVGLSSAETMRAARKSGRGRLRWQLLSAGGTDGNEQLTTLTGVLLIGLLAVIGLTILRIGQLISVHLFVGLLLLGPVAVKLASTGYRFVRYYIGNPAYRQQGAPELVLRLIAPIVVLTTVIVFVSGIVLMFDGPQNRGQWLTIHKASFIVWGVFIAAHVLGHLPGVGGVLRATAPTGGERTPGSAGRWITIAGGIVGGVVLAILLIPQFAPWTAHGAFLHHHHG